MKEALSMVREGAVTIPEAMKLTGFGRTFLYDAMNRGELPYLKIRGGRRIPRRALEVWMVRHLMVGHKRVTDEN